MNSSIHIDNKGKDILILGLGPTQGLGENSLTAEKIVIYLSMVKKLQSLKQKILTQYQGHYV